MMMKKNIANGNHGRWLKVTMRLIPRLMIEDREFRTLASPRSLDHRKRKLRRAGAIVTPDLSAHTHR